MFGFESPAEYLTNERNGTDFESSWAVWISASSESAALAWGRQIAEQFCLALFASANMAPRSWSLHGFAHWITNDASELARARECVSIPTVVDGEMPDFSWALQKRNPDPKREDGRHV